MVWERERIFAAIFAQDALRQLFQSCLCAIYDIIIAAAIVNNCDFIVSWNFRHIVNVETIKGINLFPQKIPISIANFLL